MIEINDVRIRAWSNAGVHFESGRLWDDLDADACHFCVLHDGVVIAAVRMTLHEKASQIPMPAGLKIPPEWRGSPAAFLSRLVVDHNHLGRGLAPRLLQCATSACETTAAASIVAFTTVPKIERRCHGLGYVTYAHAMILWGNQESLGSLLLKALHLHSVRRNSHTVC